MLDLPGQDWKRPRSVGTSGFYRGRRAGAGRRATECSTGLPDAPDHRYRNHAIVTANRRSACRTEQVGVSPGRRTRNPHPVRGLRAFTRFAEHKLPYDVVFVLNRYFAAMGTAIEDAGGHVDKFIGDGVMALFGIEADIETAARQSFTAMHNMAANLGELNQLLSSDLVEPLRIGIGVHAGTVIVGEMGYKHAVSLTAIGDAANTASRLEALTKELGGQAVISQKVVDYSGFDLTVSAVHEVSIRGRREPMRVHAIEDATQLNVMSAATAAP
ncbi:MAG: adenylate/guanylate cyclase domain-containing protein [Alphaproteobacteria bacterium]|nr:adenylate/guanylate cyclase domain-containing protein [Alphaproteobacteria bacterium]